MPIVGRCPHFLEPDVSSCFVNTGASHMEASKLRKPIDSSGSCILRMHYMWSLQLFKMQLFTMIFIPVVEHAPTLRHTMFLLIFPFLFIYHSFHVWPKWFSTLYSEWSSFNGSNLLQKWQDFFVLFSKKLQIMPGINMLRGVLTGFLIITDLHSNFNFHFQFSKFDNLKNEPILKSYTIRLSSWWISM